MKILAALLLATNCAIATRLPQVKHYDTSKVENLFFAPSVISDLFSAYEAQTATNKEQALCLYGSIRGDTLVASSTRPSNYIRNTESNVVFADSLQGCPEAIGFLGGVHTHPVLPDGTVVNFFTPDDKHTFWRDSRALVLLLLYAQKGDFLFAVFELRDGRWSNTLFRRPDTQ